MTADRRRACKVNLTGDQQQEHPLVTISCCRNRKKSPAFRQSDTLCNIYAAALGIFPNFTVLYRQGNISSPGSRSFQHFFPISTLAAADAFKSGEIVREGLAGTLWIIDNNINAESCQRKTHGHPVIIVRINRSRL